MLINRENYFQISRELQEKGAVLVAVSKTKPPEAILELYEMGQRDFGENYVQELLEKQAQLPPDIRWHFIGHLQSNKVRYLAPFVHLIHGVDSLKLLKEINKQAIKVNRTLDVLLQVHIAREETKFGFDEPELLHADLVSEVQGLANLRIRGLMGMASFSENKELVRSEFRMLKHLFDKLAEKKRMDSGFEILSMGMSGDYKIALEEGSNLVRIGSSIFGNRKTN